MYERKRIDLRVTADQRAALEKAAADAGKTITQFILDAVSKQIAGFPESKRGK